MSTNALIALQNPDGTVTAIYLHWDGDEAGATLAQHYSTPERARALLDLGDLSQLYARIAPEPLENHTYSTPAPGVTVAYYRDRGEPITPPSQFTSVAEFWREALTDDPHPWNYLLTPDGWQANGEPLSAAMATA